MDENGKPVKTVGMQLVDFTRQLTRLPEGTKDVTIEVSGMGGSVPVAKAMRSVIKAYAGRINFTSKQIGDIASAHTIVFSAPPKRLAAKGINPETGAPYWMLVHEPWVGHTEGTADDLAAESEDLRVTEDELIAIYQEDTGIDREAIAPLMKVESTFDADMAVDLGFATDTYPALNQAAYKSTTMAKKTTAPTLAQRVLAALGITETSEKVATAPPAALMGKPVVIEGAPAVDGVYTVVGGVITALAPAPEAQAPAAQAAPGAAAAAAAPAATVGLTEEKVVALIKELTKKKKTKTADPDEDEEDDDQPAAGSEERIAVAVAKALNTSIDQRFQQFGKSQRATHVPVGFKPENKLEDAKEWDRSFKANEHTAMKRDNPEKWQRLFYAKYGRMPQE